MPALPLTTALAPYGHVQALTDGTLSSGRQERYLDRVRSATTLTPEDAAIQGVQAVCGSDPLPYGATRNRSTIEALLHFNVEQQIIPHPVAVEELFPRSVLDLA